MERLTERKYGEIVSVKREETGISCSSFCNNCSQGTGNCKYVKEMVEKLAEYEDFYNAIVPLVRAGIPLICSRMSDNDELIDRKALKEEIESLRMTITGMRSGKTITIQALEEYKKSILRIIDEQPTVHANDGWIPVDERLPEVQEGLEDMYCPEFNVTIKGAERTTTLKYSWDGTWFDDYGTVYNVIAWQPLPERYKGGDDRA